MSRWRLLTGVVVLATWAAFYGWPLAGIVSRSVEGVAGRSGLSFDAVGAVFSDPRLGRLALLSVGQCLVSTVGVTLLGVPIGWVLGRFDFVGRRAISALVMTPFVLPTFTVAGAMLALAGGLPRSDAARFGLIIAAHVVFNLGLMVRSVSAAVSTVSPTIEEAAATLGRSRYGAVWTTTFAAIRPQVAGAAIVVAVFCLTSFGVIVALGGASIGTVEVEVWYLTTQSLDLGRAAVLAGAQLVVIMGLVIWYQRLRSASLGRTSYPLRHAGSAAERRIVRAAVGVVTVVSGLPLVALVVRSLRDDSGWTVANYRAILGVGDAGGATGRPPGAGSPLRGASAVEALGYTLSGALVATVVALAIALPVVALAAKHDRVGRWFEGAMIVPLALSAATLGFGFLVAFSGPTLDLRGSWIVVPLVQAAGAAPVVVRVVLAAARAFDRSQLDAAAVSGAGPGRRLATVVWPGLRRPVAVAAGFAFAMSVGEFGATVFLSRQDRPTVAVLIGRLLGRPGEANLGQALALSCVLGMIAAVSVLVVDRSAADGPTF